MLSGDQLYFVHLLPRRTRLKVPRRRRDCAYFADLGRRLAALSGVESVTVTPETASVVVHHGPDFRWSTVRLGAMGLHAAVPRSASDQTGTRRHAPGPGQTSLASALLWLAKVIWAGGALQHVLDLVASALIQHALDELFRSEPARA